VTVLTASVSLVPVKVGSAWHWAKVLLLDEVGEGVPLGPDSYLQFMQQLADAFAQCR
jgi:ABC-type Zn2+ transport system substrate-binding protein/surface adhesin